MTQTVLIGLDGATFTLLDRLMSEGHMPSLRRFVETGVRADLLSTPNPFTPPAWTTLATGRGPGHHGIFDFVRVTVDGGRPQYIIATSQDVRCETIWSMASRQGRRVASLNFPLMFPVQPVDGYVVPGFVPWRHLRRNVHPPELYARLEALPGFDPAEMMLNVDLEREALQVLPHEEYEEWVRMHIRRERQWGVVADHLLIEDPCDLTAVLFDGVDKLQHLAWRFLDTDLFPDDPTPWERTVREACLDYFRELDAIIAKIVALAGPLARFFIVSDHGFGPTHEVFYVNAWLHQHGYLEWAEGATADALGRQMTEGHRSPTVLFDWSRTRACALTAGSNGIYLRNASGPGEPGIPPEEYAAVRERLIDELLKWRAPDGGQVVTEVLRAEEAFPGAEAHNAPDLTLVLRDRGFISVLNSDVLVRPRTEVMGTHRPEGIFLAMGPGIRRGVRLPPLRIQDVTPLLLYSLSLPIPENLDGFLPMDVLTPETLAAEPPSWGSPGESHDAQLVGAGAALDAAAEERVLDRLKALGYLE